MVVSRKVIWIQQISGCNVLSLQAFLIPWFDVKSQYLLRCFGKIVTWSLSF